MLHLLKGARVGADAEADTQAGAETADGEQAPAVTLSDLYRRYARPIYRYVYRRTGNRQDAEDVTEQVFMDALQGLERYEEQGRRPPGSLPLPGGGWPTFTGAALTTSPSTIPWTHRSSNRSQRVK